MCEEDFKYLAISNFGDWKNFIITRYLRTELEMGTTEPAQPSLQRIQEVGDEDKQDEPASMLVITEEEKAKIQSTRNRLTAWFGV